MTTTEHVHGQLDLDDGAEPDDVFQRRLAAVEAADDAPESLRCRVAAALYSGWYGRPAEQFTDEPAGCRSMFLAQADNALAVILEDARR